MLTPVFGAPIASMKLAARRPWLGCPKPIFRTWARRGGVQTEFESALSIQVRKAALGKRQADEARQKFAEVLTLVRALNVIEQDYVEAALSCRDAASGLRGGDALHLAVAQRHGCTSLASLDSKMQACAQRIGFKLIDWQ
jgi:uncharacterized protein